MAAPLSVRFSSLNIGVLRQIPSCSLYCSRFRSMIDDQWWLGVNKCKEALSPEFPDSLFQSFNVHWDNGEFEKLSPWDMEPVDSKRKPAVVGGGVDVTADEYKALLYVPKKTEWPSCGREKESYHLVNGDCLCQDGWTGDTCDDDIDECSETGELAANCTDNFECVNQQGSFSCECFDGYYESDSLCLECDEGFYGNNCSSECSCNTEKVQSCNKIVFIPLWVIMCIALIGLLYVIAVAIMLLRSPDIIRQQRHGNVSTAIGYTFFVIPLLVFEGIAVNKGRHHGGYK